MAFQTIFTIILCCLCLLHCNITCMYTPPLWPCAVWCDMRGHVGQCGKLIIMTCGRPLNKRTGDLCPIRHSAGVCRSKTRRTVTYWLTGWRILCSVDKLKGSIEFLLFVKLKYFFWVNRFFFKDFLNEIVNNLNESLLSC